MHKKYSDILCADNNKGNLHSGVYDANNMCMCVGVACACVSPYIVEHRERLVHQLLWSSREKKTDLFTLEYLPTSSTHTEPCVSFCLRTPGPRLRASEEAGESVVEETRFSSVSFIGFSCSTSSSSNSFFTSVSL